MKKTFLIGFICAACTGHMAQESEPQISVAQAEQTLSAIEGELFRPGTGQQLELRSQVRDLLKTDVGVRVFKDTFAAATPEQRTNLLLVAALFPTKELVPLLTPAMQVPSTGQHAKKLDGDTVVDVDFENSLLSTDVFVDTYLNGGADSKALDEAIDRADPQIARYIGARLASKGKLTSDAKGHLMARGIDAKQFRPLTSEEERSVTRPNFGSRSASRNASSTPQSSADGPMTPAPTVALTRGSQRSTLASIGTGYIGPGLGDRSCLVSDWWQGSDTLDFWFHDDYCDDSFIADAWNRFHMGDGRAGWGAPPYGGNDPCNMDYPLARTLAGIYVLNYAGTSSPDCNYGGPMLNWATCYAASNISFIQVDCEASGTLAAETDDNPISGDDHTVLFPNFFFNETIVKRAADLLHEARHAEGVCNHTSGCNAGGRNCDPSFGSDGCVGPLSANGDGTYTFTFKYLLSYLRSAQDGMINDSIRRSVVSAANTVLGQNFEKDPCFRILDLFGRTEMVC